MTSNTNEIRYKGSNPLGFEPVGKLLVRFAIPSVASMIVNAIYNMVDQIFIGQGVGYLGNAATTIAFPIVTIILALSTLLGAGGSAYASIKLGEHDEEQAERVLGNSLILSIIVGTLVMILGVVFLEPLVKLFGARTNTLQYAKDYTFYILLAAPFNVLGIMLSNFARCDGAPVLAMISMVTGAVLNIILDPVFIFIFNLGVEGAAIATAISQVISALILIWYFAFRSNMKITSKSIKLSFSICRSFCALGISSCVLHIAGTALNTILNNVLVIYGNQNPVGGDMALSAVGVVMKVSMVILSVCIGIGVGSQPILGFNRGANQPERMKKAYLLAVSFSLTVTVVGWLLCQTIPHILLRLFENDNKTFMDFAVRCMRIYMGGVFIAGLQIVTTNYFQSTGQPLKATFTSLLRQVILLIPLLLILPLFFGLDGVLYAGMISDITSGLIVAVMAVFEMKKLNKWIASFK